MDNQLLQLIIEGRKAASQNDWDSAWQHWNAAIQSEDPLNARGTIFMILATLGQFDQAIEQLNIIAQSDPLIASKYAANTGLDFWEKQEQNDIARQLLQYSFQLAQQAQNNEQIALIAGNLGNLYSAEENLESALYYYDFARQAYQQLGDTEWESNMYSSGAGILMSLNRHDEASTWLKQAINLALTHKHLQALALAYLNYGNLLGLQQKFEEAKESHKLALEYAIHLRHAEYIQQAVRSLSFDLRNLGASGKAEAHELVNTAIDSYKNSDREFGVYLLSWSTLLIDPQQEPIELADIYHALADLKYAINQMEDSLKYLKQALQIAQEAEHNDRISLYATQLSARYLDSGQLRESASYADEAISAANQSQNYGALAASVGNKGLIAFYQGQFALAIKLFTRQWELSQKYNLQNHQANAANQLGVIRQKMGQFNIAEGWYKQAIENSNDYKWPGAISALINLGHIYLNTQRQDLALASYRKAKELSIERDNIDLHFDSRINLGIVYTHQDQFHEAETEFLEAEKLNNYLKDKRKYAQLDMHQAYLWKKMGKEEEALERFQDAAHSFRELNWEHATRCAIEAAEIMMHRNWDEAALNLLLPAMNLFEKRISQLSDHQAWALHRDEEKYYKILTELVLRNFDSPTALLTAEKSRARAFRLALRRKEAGHRTSVFRGQQFIKKVTLEALTSGHLDSLKKEQVSQLLNSLSGARDPQEIELEIGHFAGFAQQLKTTFMIYSQGMGDTLHLWLLNDQFLNRYIIDLASVGGLQGLTELIATLRHQLGIPERGVNFNIAAQQLDPRESLRKLYQLLIQPAAEALPQSEGSRICFIPTGPLFQVPFSALIDTEGKYLVDQYATFITPSMYFFLSERESEGQKALVVGDPKLEDTEMYGKLPQLPFAIEEAQTIAAQYQTQALIGNEATVDKVLEALKYANIAHFAAHGLYHETQPLYSAIVLSPTEDRDGLLFAEDLKNLDLGTRMVVLSTCSSSLGTITGDGVLGLCREFLTAGVDTVLASLWAVSDHSSAFHMTRFHTALQESIAPVEALRFAQLATKELHASVSHWAPYTLWGWPD